MVYKMDTRKEVVISLEFPVQLGDRTLSEVTMRRPIIRDMIKHKLGANITIEQSMELLADLCDLVPDEMELMDLSDFVKLQDQLLAFQAAPIRKQLQTNGFNAGSAGRD